MRPVLRRPRRIHRLAVLRHAVAVAFLVAIALGARCDSTVFRGATTAAEWFGVVPLVDPLAALEVTLASGTLPPTVWLGAGTLLAVALLLGPVFCGFVCPVGWLHGLSAAVRARVVHALGLSARAVPALRLPSDLRFVVLGAVLATACVAGLPVFQTVSPINAVGWAVGFASGPGLVVLGVILVADQVAPRVFCRSLCPLGALYAVVGRFAPLRVRVVLAEAGRTPCRACSRQCPMGIPVMEEFALKGRAAIDALACTRCGACTEACPRGVLRLGFRDPNPRIVPSSPSVEVPA